MSRIHPIPRLTPTACLLLAGQTVAIQIQGRPHSVRASRFGTVCCQTRGDDLFKPFIALPPAADRDIAAEASVAASLFRPSSVPLFRPVEETHVDRQQQRRVVLLTHAAASGFQELACEVVADITTGKRAGTTWAKPLALRTSANATLAIAAHRFDPCIGWTDESTVPSTMHVFSQLAPAIFVPSAKLENAPAALALAVRCIAQAHADAGSDADDSGLPAAGRQRSESALLHAFVWSLYMYG